MITKQELLSKKVLLAHDSFTQYGGAERVFEAIIELFPDSPVYTLAGEQKVIDSLKVKPKTFIYSILQTLYKLFPRFQFLFPLIPVALKLDSLSNYDLIISSSSAYIKGLNKGQAVHVNYCHTPTRFLWTDEDYALNELPSITKPLARFYFWWLKKWDLMVAAKVNAFVANSIEVRNRIKTFYGRNAEVVYPFVDADFFVPAQQPSRDYFLIAGRLAPYKEHDLVIKVCNKLGLNLHVAGTGRAGEYLKSIAGPTIKFLGRVSDEELKTEYQNAKAFIFPQIEDFGIMPLEAAACGTPTIALAKAGSLETVISGQTGELLDNFNNNHFSDVLLNFDIKKYKKEVMVGHAKKFSKQNFQNKLMEIILNSL